MGSERNCTQISSPRQDRREVALLLLLGPEVEQGRGQDRQRRHVEGAPASRRGATPRVKACWWARLRPWPPYSTGKHSPAKPPSNSVRWSSRARAAISSATMSWWSRPPRAARGMLSASHARARRRNASTSSVAASLVDVHVAPRVRRRSGDPLAVVGRGPEQGAVLDHPAQVEVEVVVPGDPDAAVELDAVLEDGRPAVADVGLGHAHQFAGRRAGGLDGPGGAVAVAWHASSHSFMSANRCLRAWYEASGRPNE